MRPLVRVLTFNVRMLPYFSDHERARRVAAAIKSRHPAYDIICLQEVFCRNARRILHEELRHEYPYIDEASGGDRWRFDSGLFTASRYRPVHRTFEGFGLGGIFGADFLAEKGAVALELEIERGTRLLLFHTHLQSLDVYRGTRRSQLERVSRMVDRVLTERGDARSTAALLLGDLNVAGTENHDPGQSSEYSDLMQILGHPRDVFREANPEHPGLTHPSTLPTRRLDYVLALDRSGLRTWRIARSRVNPHGDIAGTLSDHLAVEAELELDAD